MTTVLLYWNHICILHKYEKMFLEELSEKLLKEDIQLKIRYFGLGYSEHMSEYLLKDDSQLPDVIVSADLEVFENQKIFRRFQDQLYPVMEWMHFSQGNALDAVMRDQRLLPFLAIPLVYYTRKPSECRNKEIQEINNLVFGGIHNSAAKTVVKAVWNRYGKQKALKILKEQTVMDMPIEAFNQVRMGRCDTAIVPSIYAMRADNEKTHLVVPKEGPILIPSYLCVRKTISEEIGRKIAEELLCDKLCSFYAESGNLITCKNGRNDEEDEYFVPEKSWIRNLDSDEFCQLYESGIFELNEK